MALLSIALLALTVFIAPRVIARLPQDHFTRPDTPSVSGWFGATRSLGLNLLGIALVLLGIALMVTPGPGLVTILIGFSLAQFPGKAWVTRRVVGHPQVMASLNWMRQRHDRPPFLTPDETPQ